ncbi:hypothetical protein ABZ942_17230 [Nocardia sp. NPDC046473]|uniref:hypothetical protein n=1 Tax=Nocardia sp. NPDC046473 TaxID=3155733 RepID=UPI0033D4B5A1
MTALSGRRIAAVLSGTALTAALVASMAGAAAAQPGPPPAPTQPRLDAPTQPGLPAPTQPGPRIAIDPVPGEPIVCPQIGPDGSVVITHGAGEDGPWATIQRDLPPGAVPATPLDTVPGVPADAVPAYPAEPGCVVASVR